MGIMTMLEFGFALVGLMVGTGAAWALIERWMEKQS